MAFITPSTTVPLQLAEVPAAIKDAGFRPGVMSIRATGALGTQEGILQVKLDNAPFSYQWMGSRDSIIKNEAFIAFVDYSQSPPVLTPKTP